MNRAMEPPFFFAFVSLLRLSSRRTKAAMATAAEKLRRSRLPADPHHAMKYLTNQPLYKNLACLKVERGVY